MLSTPEDRTEAVADVVKCLAEEFIPGIRNEVLVTKKIFRFSYRNYYQKNCAGDVSYNRKHIITCTYLTILQLYPITSSFGTPEFFSLERAAAPFFGIKVHHIFHSYVESLHFFS